MDFAFYSLHTFSARHMEDYTSRKLNPATPTKKRKRSPADNGPSTSIDSRKSVSNIPPPPPPPSLEILPVVKINCHMSKLGYCWYYSIATANISYYLTLSLITNHHFDTTIIKYFMLSSAISTSLKIQQPPITCKPIYKKIIIFRNTTLELLVSVNNNF